MPYASINELPESVKSVLLKHARDIYKEAYNSAYDQYDTPKERRDNASREGVAHKVAWSAVKKAGYEKDDDDRWHETQGGDEI